MICHPADSARIHPVITAAQLQERVMQLGEQIRQDHGDDEIVLLCILKGSFIFTADLARAITGKVQIEFLGVASYGDEMSSSGVVKITSDLSCSLEGKRVVVVEDIVDTGLTLAYLLKLLSARQPASLKVCALLEKPSGKPQVRPDYTGFTVGDDFLVGYGLDWAQRLRNLPYVGAVQSSGGDTPATSA